MTRFGSRIERGQMAADRFTQISNALFRDPRLSFKAKGVFGLISTHRDGYGLTVAAIVKSGREGRDAVQSALAELEQHGYLERVQQHGEDGKFAGVVCRITDMPAHLYELLGDEATRLPAQTRTGDIATSEPLTDFPSTDEPAPGNPHPKNTSHKNTRVEEDEGEAPSARSAHDARRASTGSSARTKQSGSAASDTAGTTPGKGRRKGPALTSEQVAAVAVVEGAMPQRLAERLPYGQLPTSVRQLIAAELEHRTAPQLAQRVTRRWEAHRYANDALSQEGRGITSPVGVAVALVRSGECPDLSCEDGFMVDTRAACRACEERHAARAAASAQRRQEAKTPGQWTCDLCHGDHTGTAPADGVCPECKEAAAAMASLRARLEAQEGTQVR